MSPGGGWYDIASHAGSSAPTPYVIEYGSADIPPPSPDPSSIVNLAVQMDYQFASGLSVPDMRVSERGVPQSIDGRMLNCVNQWYSGTSGLCELSYPSNTVIEIEPTGAFPFEGWEHVPGRTGPFCESASGRICRITLTNSTTVKARFGVYMSVP